MALHVPGAPPSAVTAARFSVPRLNPWVTPSALGSFFLVLFVQVLFGWSHALCMCCARYRALTCRTCTR